MRLPKLDVRRLAADYSRLVRTSLSPAQLRRAIREKHAPCDPVSDYVDANDLMAAAVTKQLGNSWHWSEVVDDINMAWSRAREHDYTLMRVLVGCEESGRVRDAFAAKGHNAMSCDLMPTDQPGPHYQGDVFDVIDDDWEAGLFFPPCTYLAASQWWRCVPDKNGKWSKGRDPERRKLSDEALAFVARLLTAPMPKIALENPVGRISTAIAKPNQIIQPYEYGDDASKQTCLWLIGLPPLVPDPADYVEPRIVTKKNGSTAERWANQCDESGADRMSPGPNRGRDRSRTYHGVAKAMAEQWTPVTA